MRTAARTFGTVHQEFEVQAARRPGATALIGAQGTMSYAELNGRANRLAHRLRALGVTPETRIALRTERGFDLVVAMLGTLKAGAMYVPVDRTLPPELVAFMLRDSAAPVLLTQSQLAADARAIGGDAREVQAISLDQMDWSDPAYADDNPVHVVTREHLAYATYTSGSTGQPKATEIPHRAVFGFMDDVDYVAVDERCTFLQHSSPSWDAFTLELWTALLHGARCVLFPAPRLTPEGLQEAVTAHGVDVLWITSSLFNAVLDANPSSLRGVKQLLVGGEALSVPHIRRALELLPDIRLVNGYGPSECTVFATCYVIPRPLPERLEQIPIGRAIGDRRVRILDEHLNLVPLGVPGELCIAGDSLARGYTRRAALTAEKFVPDPYADAPGARLYRTGDRVRYRSDRTLEFLGRIDQQVKLRGNRLELGEVEAVLARHPGVGACAVTVREDSPGDRRLVAYVVPAAESAPSPGAWREFLAARLASFAVPSSFVTLAALPLTSTGKVDRGALPAPPRERPGGLDTAYGEARSELECALLAIWRDALALDRIGVHDNFFDLGGTSLRLIRVHGRIVEELAADVATVELFQYPTIASLAARLAGEAPATGYAEPATAGRGPRAPADDAIAIIGMAGRFPGARDVRALWRNVAAGVESISRFTDDELLAAGVRAELLAHPGYVKAAGVLEDVEAFDAGLFGYSPREAELIDPQQRLFLECAWEALENAGYAPRTCPGRVGVFGGTAMSGYLLDNLYWRFTNRHRVESDGTLRVAVGNDKDFLTTRVSYKLGLRGPSFDVQTACSTSLVATVLGCESLLSGQSTMALCGGVSIAIPAKSGYLYTEEGTFSPDGRCRPFDASASGTVMGSGVAIVVLKRLADALADGDPVRAVIRGFAMNNDGAAKVGFTAPGVEGQAEAIAQAIERAGLRPPDIGYVETHGTGTALGDPIEVAALSKAFGSDGDGAAPCAIGSLKANVGHLNMAAGVSGLIKATLALEHGKLPPSINCDVPNPAIGFERTPFRVNTVLRDWPAGAAPRRAGVSSFGLGGTNAHVVVEEAPLATAGDAGRSVHLLVLSARSEAALAASAARLADHLETHPELLLADVAYTLQVGREALPVRRLIPCRTASDAVTALRDAEGSAGGGAGATRRLPPDAVDRPVVFMFPGQGSQHAGMAAGAYRDEPVFRQTIERCATLLEPHLGLDLIARLFPDERPSPAAAARLGHTDLAQCIIFAVEYALARLWMSWGIRPRAMIGHSIGEYVAATVAGVFSLEDALAVVAERGRLIETLPESRMLSVALGQAEVAALLPPGLELGAINGPLSCIVSGDIEPIAALERELAVRGVVCRTLHSHHAGHCALMDPIVEALTETVRGVALNPPELPYIANVTGTWADPAVVSTPEYWGRHLRETVRFSSGVETLLEDPTAVLLEVGAGNSLARLVKQHPDPAPSRPILASLPHAKDEQSDEAVLMSTVGSLWLEGATVSWSGLHAGWRRRRVELPSYPFERTRYWIDRTPLSAPEEVPAELSGAQPTGPAVILSSWRQARRSPSPAHAAGDGDGQWLVLEDGAGSDVGLGAGLAAQLTGAGRRVLRVTAGSEFDDSRPGCRVIRPDRAEDFHRLVDDLGAVPLRVVHLWPVQQAPGAALAGANHLAGALRARAPGAATRLHLVTRGALRVAGEAAGDPAHAALHGLVQALADGPGSVTCQVLDLPPAGTRMPSERRLPDWLLAEVEAETAVPVVAWRGGRRWVRDSRTVTIEDARGDGSSALRAAQPFLVVVPADGPGIGLAAHLDAVLAGELVLLARDGAARGRAAGLRGFDGDPADPHRLRAVLATLEAEAGTVGGVFYDATGAPAEPLDARLEEADAVVAACAGAMPAFVALLSSTPLAALGATLGAALGALAEQRDGPLRVVAIDWSVPTEPAMNEGLDGTALAVIPGILDATDESSVRIPWRPGRAAPAPEAEAPAAASRHPRPDLLTPFLAPRTPLETALAEIWQEVLGLERAGVEDNLFSLGGDSLAGVQIVHMVKRRLDAQIPMASLYEHPTIASLAGLIGDGGAPGADERGVMDARQARGARRRSLRGDGGATRTGR